MGPIRSGKLVQVAARTGISSADGDSPNTTAPTTPLAPATRTRSKDAWVVVRNTATTGAPSIVVTVYGALTNATHSWVSLGQMNSGAAMAAGHQEPSSPIVANRLYVAEAFPGLLAWPFLWLQITGTLNGTYTLEILGEQP